jgi:osmotically inducible lipoprotein OsmB
MKYVLLGPVVAASLFAAACGTTTGDRAASGGLLGAGAGALVGSVTGSAVGGAVIGGVAGAAIGALTSPQDVNLGTPAWRSSHYCVRRYENGRCAQTARR